MPLMQMFLAGKWSDAAKRIEVKNPFDGSVVDTVPQGTPEDVQRAVTTLVDGANKCVRAPRTTAAAGCGVRPNCCAAHRDFAKTISAEEGKVLAESRMEVSRSAENSKSLPKRPGASSVK